MKVDEDQAATRSVHLGHVEKEVAEVEVLVKDSGEMQCRGNASHLQGQFPFQGGEPLRVE